MINVTKSFLPPLEEYSKYLEGIWERNWLTNYGPLVNELEKKLQEYLQVSNLQFTSNGTIALQLAIKALEIKGEVITTPYSYVATTGAILWENCTPVFVDIEDKTFCIDAEKIEAAITEKTTAILATHVYGLPCDVQRIDAIAKKHNLKVVYDGAHAFGVKVGGKSIFEYGDISTCSFHATKLFHSVEGGAVISNDSDINKKIFLLKTFGHQDDDHFSIGINGKNSEFHAAMGLCILPRVKSFIKRRKEILLLYREALKTLPLTLVEIPLDIEYNYSYFPVLFKDEKEVLKVKQYLSSNEVNARRYFFPSLNTLPYLKLRTKCPVSENIASRVLCLPYYQQLTNEEVLHISSLVKEALYK